MKTSEFKLKMKDGCENYMYMWEPEEGKNIHGVVQLVHGSCEHSRRYFNFAEFLTANGYIVYANDLRGHGLTVKDNKELGYFGEENGWNTVVEDLHEVTRFIKEKHKNLKVLILGHSMGSFLVRHYASIYGDEVNGVIATGTAHNPRAILKFGRAIAKMQIKKNGSKFRSEILNKMSYDSFSNQFKPIRTKQDWLTRDERIVDEYIKDELCGFVFTASAFKDMFEGLLFITDKNNIRKTPENLPILLLSGKRDPVSSNGKTVVKAFEEYKKAGLNNITMKLYEDMRHEILNEIGKEEVYEDILNWINSI
ncbi:hydrolase, alpha/beta domain protein [Clostridiales bacterium oral taxon 876 str. F0540]|nr:hydrolase, alpha/beta domain protein [Clostridiales bacterium oral taxon 876 str. F0540]